MDTFWYIFKHLVWAMAGEVIISFPIMFLMILLTFLYS